MSLTVLHGDVLHCLQACVSVLRSLALIYSHALEPHSRLQSAVSVVCTLILHKKVSKFIRFLSYISLPEDIRASSTGTTDINVPVPLISRTKRSMSRTDPQLLTLYCSSCVRRPQFRVPVKLWRY
jgi:hypothetical protein